MQRYDGYMKSIGSGGSAFLMKKLAATMAKHFSQEISVYPQVMKSGAHSFVNLSSSLILSKHIFFTQKIAIGCIFLKKTYIRFQNAALITN